MHIKYKEQSYNWDKNTLKFRLSQIAQADKNKQWIKRDLSVKKATRWQRLVWKLFGQFSCVRKWLKIDGAASSALLKEIRNKIQENESEYGEITEIFQKAVLGFNKVTKKHKIAPTLEDCWKQFDTIEDCWKQFDTIRPLSAQAGLSILKNEENSNDRVLSHIPSLKGKDKILIEEFRNKKDVLFHPSSALNKQPTAEEFIPLLKDAFAQGKKFVVGVIGNERHATAVAFQADGSFRIIDSMFENSVNLRTFTKKLREADIRTPEDKPITWKGEYVCTKIQNTSSVACIRFAALYCYQMAKEKNLDGYKRVNAAFADCSLKTFEDLYKIDKNKEGFKRVPHPQQKMYKKFMESWAYRACGLSIDDWKQLPLSVLEQEVNNLAYHSVVVISSNSSTPKAFTLGSLRSHTKAVIKKTNGVKQEEPKKILGDLIPKEERERIIILKNHREKTFTAYNVPKNEKLSIEYSVKKPRKGKSNKRTIII